MSKSAPTVEIARPGDAQVWVQLGYPGNAPPSPKALQAQVKAFNAPPPDVDESRFIAWLGDKAIARASFGRLENVVELRDFSIADGYITSLLPASYGWAATAL